MPSERNEMQVRGAPEERAAQEYLSYFEQRSDEAARLAQQIVSRSRHLDGSVF